MIQCPHCRTAVQLTPQLAGQAVACPACGGPFVMPAERFDPYYTWLGIPPAEQPPHSYRLLGLALFEANASVIENAADRQMMHLRGFQAGARGADSQRLLNEVAVARIRLLDALQKATYDEQLRQLLAPRPAMMAAAPALPAGPTIASAAPRPLLRKSRPRSKSAVLSTVLTILGGAMGLALGLLLVFYITGQDFLGLSGKLRPQADRSAPLAESKPPSPREEPNSAVRPGADEPDRPQEPPADTSKPQQAAAPPHKSPHHGKAKTAPKKAPPRPAPAPPAEPKKPNAHALAVVPTAAPIPPLASQEAAPLFTLASEPTDPLRMTIHSDTANLASRASIRAEADAQGRGWVLYHLSDAGDAASKNMLAIIRREGLALTFAWTQPLANADLRRQVANCLLEISMANELRTVQLRMPIAATPLVLNLEQETQLVDYDIADPPPTTKLCLKVRELVGFMQGAKLRGNVSSTPLLKPAVIEFADMPGAEIELRLLKHPTTGQLSVRAEPIFREAANRKYELTLPNLEKMRLAQEKALRNSQADLADAQSALSNAQAAIASLNSNRPKDIQQLAVWEPRLAAARSLSDRYGKRVSSLSQQVAEAGARLSAVPKLRDFLQSLHQRATIKYLVCAVAADKELVLVDAELPRAAVSMR
jgi:hypothetical protein